jgi:hypothetical protein
MIILKSKDRQYNGQKKNDNRTNNDIYTKHFTEKYKSSNIYPTKNGGELRCSGINFL